MVAIIVIIILIILSSFIGVIFVDFILEFFKLENESEEKKNDIHITQVANDNATQIAIIINNEENKKEYNIQDDYNE